MFNNRKTGGQLDGGVPLGQLLTALNRKLEAILGKKFAARPVPGEQA